MGFLSILSYAHKLIEERVSPGETVVDATAGNGVDTLFLAKLVGAKGSVYAFDIQEQALEKTQQRLAKERPDYSHVRLLLCSHDQLKHTIPATEHGSIGAVMFNLGYLPGNDHETITSEASTIPALQQAAQLLRKGGILTIALYTGHEGGEQEAAAVREWAEGLPQQQFQVLEYRFVNQKNHPPYLIAVEKRSFD
ncbi:class I SAM-dependent methyltransferase [Paenibacillus radicis (ex Xue et al. 2023)]|uniref:Methyltransferase domain-containing protein n=1 Tax=Paenibacillus radicis (ex Xue et al. 2023) TaxID=2972489 RepID=A0ABT1YHV6_9BACL|nr:class I SAM-dependent methyltransferase [Paenibacillus radicis (ex Xue et al. 2023)]MCR8632562.1 methyltransferase domain-containing protein [Paenibacillus radicis (ex Xue et al. 2023)]